MQDLRIIRTEEAIENAMIELIELNGFNDVRLTDVAKKARVNRNTIYLHYKSKEDIVLSIINRVFTSSYLTLDTARAFSNRLRKAQLKEVFVKMLNSIDHDIELYRIVLTDPNLSGYLDKAMNKIRDLIVKKYQTSQNRQLGVEYIINGVYGVINRWIIYATGSIDEVASGLTEFAHSNIRQLQFMR